MEIDKDILEGIKNAGFSFKDISKAFSNLKAKGVNVNEASKMLSISMNNLNK